jgi:hypothetical protein
MLKGKESAYKSRQRVGGASEIIVNTHPRNTCWWRKMVLECGACMVMLS